MLYLPERDRQLLTRTLSLELSKEKIVCWDCAGDEDRPKKTTLTMAGCCSKCGGRSYELASVVFGVAGIRIRRVIEMRGEISPQTGQSAVHQAADSTVYGTSKTNRISL